jgi:hypothetical protein
MNTSRFYFSSPYAPEAANFAATFSSMSMSSPGRSFEPSVPRDATVKVVATGLDDQVEVDSPIGCCFHGLRQCKL